MKVLGLALVALLAAASGFAVYSRIHKKSAPSVKMLERYNRWKLQFGKLYSSPAEQDYRFQIFAKKAAEIDEDNIEYARGMLEQGIVLERPAFILQPHSDLTPEEFKKKYLGLDISRISTLVYDPTPELPDVPKSANLAQASYKYKIRDQGSCGSCWAFSTVATLEKHYFDKYKVQVDLSQQDLVDCSEGDNGCDGGWPADTYWHVADYGIAFAAEYPYRGSVGTCKRTSNLKTGRTTLSGDITSVTLDFKMDTAQKLANLGVVAGLAIHSSGKFSSFDFSNDAIFNPEVAGLCGKDKTGKAIPVPSIDHAVNLHKADGTYVIIQNSWSAEWGTQGFGKIKACNSNLLLGSPGYITHTYKKLPTA